MELLVGKKDAWSFILSGKGMRSGEAQDAWNRGTKEPRLQQFAPAAKNYLRRRRRWGFKRGLAPFAGAGQRPACSFFIRPNGRSSKNQDLKPPAAGLSGERRTHGTLRCRGKKGRMESYMVRKKKNEWSLAVSGKRNAWDSRGLHRLWCRPLPLFLI